MLYEVITYKPEAEEHINRVVETDEEVRDKKLEPLTKCRERANIRASVLINCMTKGRDIKLTFRNGQILTGRILSFGIFSNISCFPLICFGSPASRA